MDENRATALGRMAVGALGTRLLTGCRSERRYCDQVLVKSIQLDDKFDCINLNDDDV